MVQVHGIRLARSLLAVHDGIARDQMFCFSITIDCLIPHRFSASTLRSTLGAQMRQQFATSTIRLDIGRESMIGACLGVICTDRTRFLSRKVDQGEKGKLNQWNISKISKRQAVFSALPNKAHLSFLAAGISRERGLRIRHMHVVSSV